jgi:hypothetical protein
LLGICVGPSQFDLPSVSAESILLLASERTSIFVDYGAALWLGVAALRSSQFDMPCVSAESILLLPSKEDLHSGDQGGYPVPPAAALRSSFVFCC